MIKNKLKINDDKTEFVLVTSPYSKFTKDIQISIGQHNIAPSSSCKSLGVMFDEHFSMDTQISSICGSTHFHIRNIGATRAAAAAAAQLVHSLVTSRLDYCNALLLGIPAFKIQRLQRKSSAFHFSLQCRNTNFQKAMHNSAVLMLCTIWLICLNQLKHSLLFQYF